MNEVNAAQIWGRDMCGVNAEDPRRRVGISTSKTRLNFGHPVEFAEDFLGGRKLPRSGDKLQRDYDFLISYLNATSVKTRRLGPLRLSQQKREEKETFCSEIGLSLKTTRP